MWEEVSVCGVDMSVERGVCGGYSMIELCLSVMAGITS